MRSKVMPILATVVFLISFLLAGCQGGVAPEDYDLMAAKLQTALSKIAEMQGQVNDLQAQKGNIDAELQAAQAKVAQLQGQVGGLEGQVGGLKEQYELVGATPAETAEKIVRYYYETHEYSTSDLFICSDMASEVWNMLKAQGISAIIVVGNKDAAIGDILLSNHAWVLAEVSPGEYLALETTAGRVVTKSENALYYRGWYFDSPADLKANNQLVREYNVRVGIRNQIVAEDREVVAEHNRATNQSTADKLMAVHQKLIELIEAQEAEINKIKAEIDSLATKCGT